MTGADDTSMDESEAEEIHEYLLDAAYSFEEARAAIAALDEAEQEGLAAPLERLDRALHSELLRTMYDRFPDLDRPEEFPIICSTLRWDQIRLPPFVTEAQLDSLILSVMTTRFQKVAMIISRLYSRSKKLAQPIISDKTIAARIQLLAEDGPLESQGDLRKWRHSEVRLKPQQDEGPKAG
jgi:hypothetical protein